MAWFWPTAMIVVALAFLALPLLRPAASRSGRLAHDLEVYRDQLRELKADLERGVIGPAEAAAAEREIERRILRAADAEAESPSVDIPWRKATAVVLAMAVPAAAIGLYLKLGAPGTPDQPLAARDLPSSIAAMPPDHAQADALDALTEKLVARLAKEPDDRQGWILLGNSYRELGRYADAAAAFQRALALDADDAQAQMAFGEALVFAADGIVTPSARLAFEKAQELSAGHPGARYYLALAELQDGHGQAAYDQWLALARDTPPGAPWIPALKARLEQVGAGLGIDAAVDLPAHFKADGAGRPAAGAAPEPTEDDIAAAAKLSPEERQTFIRSMVDRLAERLRQQPDDADGWLRLGRAHMVLNEPDKAKEAYARAAALRPESPEVLVRYARAITDAAGPDAPPPPEAVALYRRVLALRPNHAEALWFTGLADAMSGKRDAAIAAWEKLLAQIDPDAPQYAQIKAEIARLKKAD